MRDQYNDATPIAGPHGPLQTEMHTENGQKRGYLTIPGTIFATKKHPKWSFLLIFWLTVSNFGRKHIPDQYNAVTPNVWPYGPLQTDIHAENGQKGGFGPFQIPLSAPKNNQNCRFLHFFSHKLTNFVRKHNWDLYNAAIHIIRPYG